MTLGAFGSLEDFADALACSRRAFEVLLGVDLRGHSLALYNAGWSAVVRGEQV